MNQRAEKLSVIKEYYGKILRNKKDLQTNTCCSPDAFPPYLKVIMLVCGNTASMVEETRYGKHFKVTADRRVHYGPFPCGAVTTKPDEGGSPGPCVCG